MDKHSGVFFLFGREVVLEKIFQKIKKSPQDYQAYEDLYGLCVVEENWVMLKELSGFIMNHMHEYNNSVISDIWKLHKKIVKALAHSDFDSFMLYVEWNREPGAR